MTEFDNWMFCVGHVFACLGFCICNSKKWGCRVLLRFSIYTMCLCYGRDSNKGWWVIFDRTLEDCIYIFSINYSYLCCLNYVHYFKNMFYLHILQGYEVQLHFLDLGICMFCYAKQCLLKLMIMRERLDRSNPLAHNFFAAEIKTVVDFALWKLILWID